MATIGIRPVRVEGNLAYVPLSQGYEAVIDASDAPFAATRNWNILRCQTKRYAITRYKGHDGKWRAVFLHRVILVASGEFDVDHRNGDGLDCRLDNLRQATRSQNVMNSCRRSDNKSGFKGVSLDRYKSWRAEIKIAGKTKYLGAFRTPEAAHQAYVNAAREHHGAFANAG